MMIKMIEQRITSVTLMMLMSWSCFILQVVPTEVVGVVPAALRAMGVVVMEAARVVATEAVKGVEVAMEAAREATEAEDMVAAEVGRGSREVRITFHFTPYIQTSLSLHAEYSGTLQTNLLEPHQLLQYVDQIV